MRTLFLDPGKLRSELALEACATVADGLGGHDEELDRGRDASSRCSSRFPPQSVFGADQTLETVTHRVTMRWREGVASGMRFSETGSHLRRS